MKLYFKEKFLAFDGNDLFLADEEGNKKYSLKSSTLLTKTIRVFDALGNEVAAIKQELKSLRPKYSVYIGEQKVMEVTKEFSLLLPKYTLTGLGWEIKSPAIYHNYEICKDGQRVVSIREVHRDWSDTYEIDIAEGCDELTAVAVILAIDYGIEGESFMQKK